MARRQVSSVLWIFMIWCAFGAWSFSQVEHWSWLIREIFRYAIMGSLFLGLMLYERWSQRVLHFSKKDTFDAILESQGLTQFRILMLLAVVLSWTIITVIVVLKLSIRTPNDPVPLLICCLILVMIIHLMEWKWDPHRGV